MEQAAAYSALGMTLSLVVVRPRIGDSMRLPPAVAACAGVLLMFLFGVLTPGNVTKTALDVWRSFVALGSIMVMTEVAMHVGLLSWLAARIDSRAANGHQLFALVFVLSVLTASAINNDAAILLLTPLVITLIRRRYPDRPAQVIPFAFAVFMAAGVAPLMVSNPMNMIVAEFAGIGFNEYAREMIPVALVGWLVAFLVLRRVFRHALALPLWPKQSASVPMTRPHKQMLSLLGGILIAYSVTGALGGPVWSVALVGAYLALVIGARQGASPVKVVCEGVSWETLAFLFAVLVLSAGLLNVGLAEHLINHYRGAGSFGIGLTSAVGSAIVNNHPMAYMNMMALDQAGHDSSAVLAALVGGDLGPRLLPMGSLAGLLWLEMLRRQGIDIKLGQFFRVGALVTVPALIVSLWVLGL